MSSKNYKETLTINEAETIISSFLKNARIMRGEYEPSRNSITNLLDVLIERINIEQEFGIDFSKMSGGFLNNGLGEYVEEFNQDLKLSSDLPTKHDIDKDDSITFRPCFYSYKNHEDKYFAYDIKKTDFITASRSPEELGRFLEKIGTSVAKSKIIYENRLKREFLGYIVKKIFQVYDIAKKNIFDITKKYDLILEKDPTTQEIIQVPTYVCDSSTPTKYGVVFKPIEANKFTSFDDAVENGYIVLLDLIEEIDLPIDVENTDLETKEEKTRKFLTQIRKLEDTELGVVTQGHSFSGNVLGNTQLNNLSVFGKEYIKLLIEDLKFDVRHNEGLTPAFLSSSHYYNIKDSSFGTEMDKEHPEIAMLAIDQRGAKQFQFVSEAAVDHSGMTRKTKFSFFYNWFHFLSANVYIKLFVNKNTTGYKKYF